MAKAMQDENPIVAVRQVEVTNESMAYTENIMSFQSAGPTNISGVNNLPSLQLYVKQREREGEELIKGFGKLSRMKPMKHTSTIIMGWTLPAI